MPYSGLLHPEPLHQATADLYPHRRHSDTVLDQSLWVGHAFHALLRSENLMNSMKRQKDRTLKDELPRSVGAQYATGDQRRNNSRKNEETETKEKQPPMVDVTGYGSKV